MTRLADSWIPRAFHADPDNAEAEAFRWRRIYGPRRTRIAEYWVQDRPEPASALPALPPPITVEVGPVQPAILPRTVARPLSWQDAALRAFALYLVFSLANRALELLILLAG
ncbi:hypothetical protein [Ferrovibrio xuzhouensis]|uniref:Uncharacterized protein n=1 Tax=Ferrovibrio xuzhouensis TaxID=1576914 RepID=A0ABV7VL61_9PROT